MNKLLHNTAFVHITETGSYNLKGRKLDFNQCLGEVICSEPVSYSILNKTPSPVLQELLKEFEDVFSKTLGQLTPAPEIQHTVQLQGLLPKAHPLYCLTHKE